MEQLWTITQIAKRLNVSRMRVHRLVVAGRFPHAIRVGDGRTSAWLIPITDIEQYELQKKTSGCGSVGESSLPLSL